MALNYLRDMLYRPKKSDRSLMAKFYYADANLNKVAQELDSFDGRKDPERCTCLVNRLRSCQDKLLSVCTKMLEEIAPGLAADSREFRAKFPDDILTDNLAGQLWFGAECLAAGSSILNKDVESDSMRPLAKAVTRSLEKVRALLREQCLSPQPEYTEEIRENLKIFDRLFSDFEFNYVQVMVHVKTKQEYELQQDLIVLFSETLRRAIKHEMVTQDMVDLYEPSLMFAIPRLAIVYGTLHFPDGPLCVDQRYSDFPALFKPFHNLIIKIRELLLTLAPHEVVVLEMLLCQHEEPANITAKLKEVEAMLAAREKTQEGLAAAELLQQKLEAEPEVEQQVEEEQRDEERERRRRQRRRHREGKEVVYPIMRDLISDVVDLGEAGRLASAAAAAVERHNQSHSAPPPPVRTTRRLRVGGSSSTSNIVEIDCTDPEIRVSSNARLHRNASTPAVSSLQQQQQQHQSTGSLHQQQQQRQHRHHHHRRVEVSVVGAEESASSSSSPSSRHHHHHHQPRQRPTELVTSCSREGESLPVGVDFSPRPKQRLKRHNAKRDTRRIPHKYQKSRRHRFKCTEDLLHRLYVCISGAADQLQSNQASDFRAILKTVFFMNVSRDDDDDEEEEEPNPTEEEPEEEAAAASGNVTSPTSRPPPTPISASFPPLDVAADALQEQASNQLANEFLPRLSIDDGDEGPSSGLSTRYARNLDLQLQQQQDEDDNESIVSVAVSVNAASSGAGNARTSRSNSRSGDGGALVDTADAERQESGGGGGGEGFFQSEPTLLNIASGSRSGSVIDDRDLPPESRATDSLFQERQVEVRRPPRWVPDAEAPVCRQCGDAFTFLRRRHHCRNCGHVFCHRCSSHAIPLVHFQMHRHVRVCDQCFAACQFPQTSTRGRLPTEGDDDEDEDEEDEEMLSPGIMATTPTAGSSWGSRRSLGMIS